MKIRRGILTLLLNAFVFIAMHDYIIAHIDPDTQVELYMQEIDNTPLCDSSNLHEHVHSSMMTILELLQDSSYIYDNRLALYFEELNPYIFFNYDRLDRPPIA